MRIILSSDIKRRSSLPFSFLYQLLPNFFKVVETLKEHADVLLKAETLERVRKAKSSKAIWMHTGQPIDLFRIVEFNSQVIHRSNDQGYFGEHIDERVQYYHCNHAPLWLFVLSFLFLFGILTQTVLALALLFIYHTIQLNNEHNF